MFSILKPFLFNLDPETAHNLAIKSLKFNYLPTKIFEIEDDPIMTMYNKEIEKQFLVA